MLLAVNLLTQLVTISDKLTMDIDSEYAKFMSELVRTRWLVPTSPWPVSLWFALQRRTNGTPDSLQYSRYMSY